MIHEDFKSYFTLEFDFFNSQSKRKQLIEHYFIEIFKKLIEFFEEDKSDEKEKKLGTFAQEKILGVLICELRDILLGIHPVFLRNNLFFDNKNNKLEEIIKNLRYVIFQHFTVFFKLYWILKLKLSNSEDLFWGSVFTDYLFIVGKVFLDLAKDDSEETLYQIELYLFLIYADLIYNSDSFPNFIRDKVENIVFKGGLTLGLRRPFFENFFSEKGLERQKEKLDNLIPNNDFNKNEKNKIMQMGIYRKVLYVKFCLNEDESGSDFFRKVKKERLDTIQEEIGREINKCIDILRLQDEIKNIFVNNFNERQILIPVEPDEPIEPLKPVESIKQEKNWLIDFLENEKMIDRIFSNQFQLDESVNLDNLLKFSKSDNFKQLRNNFKDFNFNDFEEIYKNIIIKENIKKRRENKDKQKDEDKNSDDN